MATKKNKRTGAIVWTILAFAFALPLLGVALRDQAGVSKSFITQPVFMCGSGLSEKVKSKDSLFESVPVRPMALSDKGDLLFVINSPADCLEVYSTENQTLSLVSSVTVGVDPVAVAVRTESEIWVVNHISDSVSIISLDGKPHVKQTLQVGDAPWDIVFTNGPGHGDNPERNHRDRAFITSSFLGQNHPQFKLEHLLLNRLESDDGESGELIGRADLWVFDVAEDKPPVLAGLINFFTTPLRSLSIDSRGTRVFATAFKSGNRTAITPIPFDALPGEKWSAEGVGNVEPFAIVQQQDDGRWLDVNGREWKDFINFDVSDNDLFVVDAMAPLRLGNAENPVFNRHAILETVEGVGSVLFNNVYDETNNRVLVSTVDANNLVPMQENLKGEFVSNHLKIVDLDRSPATIEDINLDELLGVQGYKPGFALPGGILVLADEGTAMVAAMGTSELVAFDIDEVLERPASGLTRFEKSRVPLGPIAMLQGRNEHLLYSYSYIDNSVSILRRSSEGLEKAVTIDLFNPELEEIAAGRQYLYDAVLTSSNNRVSCGSCHIYAGDDRLQWVLDKGGQNVIINHLPFVMHDDRKTSVRPIPLQRSGDASKVGEMIPFGDIEVEIKYIGDQKGFADRIDSGEIALNQSAFVYLTEGEHDPRLNRFKILTGAPTWALIETPFFHSLRGPMRTIPLHGIADSGAMHYLGDRSGLVLNEEGPCSDVNATQEERAFREFNVPCDGGPGTFETLQGGGRLPDKFMDELTAFSLALTFPPNPIRPLDNQVNREGERLFNVQKVGTDLSDWNSILNKGPLTFTCVDCHTIDRKNRLFGTSTKVYSAPPLSIQDSKMPHLRFLYDRAGFLRGDYRKITGFLNMETGLDHFDKVVHAQGLNHGGWFDFSMFFADMVWVLNPDDPTAYRPESNAMYFDLFQYLMEFDTNHFPMYGKQLTVSAADLRNREGKSRVSAFMEKALSTLDEEGIPQCTMRLTVVSGDDAKEVSVTRFKELERVMKRSEIPVTLTCL